MAKISEIYTEISVKGMAGFKSSMATVKKLSRAAGRSIEVVAKAGKIGFAALGVSAAFAVKAASDQEKAEKQLEAAIKATGHSIDEYGQKLKNAAGEIQALSTFGDEALMPIMSLGLNMGVGAEQIERVTKGAIGLSKALDMDLNTAMKNVALATNGEFTMLQRYVPELRKATTQSERLAIVTKVMQQGWEQAQAETDTLQGSLTQLWNDFGDLAEVVGGPLVNALRGGVEWLKRIIPAQEVVVFWVTKTTQTIKNMVRFWVEAYALMETVVKNFGAIVGNIFDSIKLLIMQFVNDIAFFFTEQIPQHFENFIEAAKDIPGRIKQALKGEIGFDEVLAPFDEMPDVAERQATAAEKKLAAKIINMWDGLDKESKKRADEILRVMGLEGATPGEDTVADKIGDLGISLDNASKKDKAKRKKERDASFVGVAEMARKLQLSVMKKGEDEAQRTRDKQLKVQGEIRDATNKTNKALANLKPAGMGA